MNFFSRLSLKMKILLGVLLASALAVSTASIVFVTLEDQQLHRALERDSLTIAKVVAGNAAGALAFEDADSASETLATMAVHKQIDGAVFFTTDGSIFATYERGNESLADGSLPKGFGRRPGTNGFEYTDNHIQLTESVSADGSQVGTIVMRVNLDELNAQLNKFTGAAISITIVLGLVSAVLAFFIQLAITTPIKTVVSALRDIAEGEGDLTQRLEVNGSDEIADLAKWFNMFLEKIHGMTVSFRDTAIDLGQSSGQLSQITEKTNQGVLKQQTEIDQIATAITQMSGTVQEVVHNVASAAQDAEEADIQASQGKAIVDETMQSIENLAGEIESASDVISRLQQESDNIGAVLEVIGGIAEQTNLLALNAAIEAARAGEQGRGFAVVADEVRTLASRTQSSTQEIQEMIDRLQAGAKEAVKVMEKGREQASTSVVQAEKAGESLEGITKAVSVIKDMSQQIANASEEQRCVTEEINESIVNISQIAGQTADDSRSIANGSDELNSLASNLNSLIGQFKL